MTRPGAPAPDEPQGDWIAALPDERLAHLVRMAARGFNRALQIRLARHDVSFGHWVFLRILWEHDGLTQRDLSQRAGLTEPTAFSALTAMQKLGFVTREPDPHSRRTVRVRLTARGRELRNVLVPLAEEVNQHALFGIPPADVAAARRVLLAAIANLAMDEAGGVYPPMPSTRALARLIQARASAGEQADQPSREDDMHDHPARPRAGRTVRR